MAQEFVKELRGVQPTGPYLLGGHCVGGVAALEVAHLLLQEGEQVKLMVFLDTDRPSALAAFFSDLYFMRNRLRHVFDVLSQIAHAGRQRGAMIRSVVRRKLHETDAFYESKVIYRRQLYAHTPKRYSGRITLIVNEEQARNSRKNLGWTGMAREGLDVHIVPGNHANVLADHGEDVAQVILRSLSEAIAGTANGNLERSEVQPA
jgi:thioesterase domain-containing protein